MTEQPLTGAQKSAVLLLLLDEPEAAELLRQLGPDEVRAVGHAMVSVAEIDPRSIDAVLVEFLDASRGTAALGAGGSKVRSVLERALGNVRAGEVIRHLSPPAGIRPFAALDWVDPATLAAVLRDEHPQVTAVVLAHLAPAIASAVLNALPDATQADLVFRLAQLQPVSIAVIGALESDLSARLAEAAVPPRTQAFAGSDIAAKLVNLAADQARLIAELETRDAELAGRIAENLFVFDDIGRLDTRALQAIAREADPAVLVVALKGAGQPLRDQIFGAMSARAASQLQDELAQLGPLKRIEVDTAQAEVARMVRRLGADGSIMLPGRAGSYV